MKEDSRYVKFLNKRIIKEKKLINLKKISNNRTQLF